jgi:ribosomal protein L18E
MEALNRIKKGVADTIQKADDEIRDRARREAERQVNGSRGASSSNGARSEPTGARRPVDTIVAHGAQVARSSRNDAANVDVELVVTTMRSELDETRRRLDDFDARLERRLTEALATLQDVAAAQTRDGVDALVREEVRRVLSENEAYSRTNTADAPSVSPVSQKQKLDQKLETFEAAMRAAETAAPVVANVGGSSSADAAEGLDAKAAAAVASEVPSWISESLRALEARVAAAEAAAEAAAATASTARLEWENDETDASDVSRGASSARDAPLRSTSERFPGELSETRERTELEALRARLEEVAEMAFSSAAAAARAEVRAEEERLASARGRKEAADPETNVFAENVEALRGEVRKLSTEVSGSAANAEHVAFAAVESSKRATEKLDELSGTVAELAEALEAARRELRESVAGFSQKTPSKNAAAERAKSSEADARREAAFEKRFSDVTTRLEDLERRDANRSASENARALRETRDAEAKESAARDAEAAATARFDETDASLASVSEKLASVARNVDDRIATIRLAVETELVTVMRTFETRLEAVETRVLHENSGEGELQKLAERASRLEARTAETMTLAESALRRADARDARDALERERVAETFASDVQNLTKAVEAIARESTDTKAVAEDSARRASERAREAALAEARQTERAVWDTVMLLSAEVASANRRRSPGSSGSSGSGTRLGFRGTRTRAGAGLSGLSGLSVHAAGAEGSTPRIRGVPVAGTPAGLSVHASSGGAKRFLGIRRLFKSPRNDVPDGETDEQGNER